MSNETAIVPRTLDEVRSLSEVLSKSALLPDALRGKASDIAVTVMAGRELGLSPMASLRGLYVVKGKPVLSADTMVGLVLSSGLAEYFQCVESTDRVATYETRRKGAPAPQRLSFTIEQAHRAGLRGGNWQTYAEAMLRARAKAALARDVYPDVLAGCYDEDEAATFRDERPRIERPAPVDSETPQVIDAEIIEPSPRVLPPAEDPEKAILRQTIEERLKPNPLRDMIVRIEAARTEDALKALEPELKALPEEFKPKARAAYRAQKKGVADGSIVPVPDLKSEPLPDWMEPAQEEVDAR